jgi:hypothetical protein
VQHPAKISTCVSVARVNNKVLWRNIMLQKPAGALALEPGDRKLD